MNMAKSGGPDALDRKADDDARLGESEERAPYRVPMEITVDLAALRHNARVVQEHVADAQVMAVVKANAYGHGLVPCARAFRDAGVPWLGTAHPAEALRLRKAGDRGRLLAWLWTPEAPYTEAVKANIDISVSSVPELATVARAAAAVGHGARIHLKVDTGLGRGGCRPTHWPQLVHEAGKRQDDGVLTVVGLWSHLAMADNPAQPSNAEQLHLFKELIRSAESAGIRPEVRHIANSAAVLFQPRTHLDLVRVGLALYGLSPAPSWAGTRDLALRPAMALHTRLAGVKRVAAGHGVGYGHDYRAPAETTLGLVPVGYADGVPWHAGGRGEVLVAGRRYRVAGRIAMDQFVVDLTDSHPSPGQDVVVFGPGGSGEPTAQDWATAAGTIAYEIVSRMSQSIPRRYLNDESPVASTEDVAGPESSRCLT